MLLRSIKLENFRQFVDEYVEFSVDPVQNVTLIIGENGTGKTTFAQAFFWCLYGETSFADKTLLNRSICERMTPDQSKTVRVTIKLIHGSAEYEIIRAQEYKKSYSNKISASNTTLNISMKLDDGNTRYLKPLECETEIKKILPKELSNYFFFDGERIEKMSKEIAAGRKSSSFANAVSGLTGLNGTLAALDHLSPTKLATSVIGKFNEDYIGDSAGKIKELTDLIDRLQKEKEENETRSVDLEEEINVTEKKKLEFETEIKKYEDGEKLQVKKERKIKELETNKRIKSKMVKDVCSDFNDDMTALFAMSLTQSALEVVSRSDFEGKDIPAMHSKTIEYLLNRGTCLCGTPLIKGGNSYKKLVDLIAYLPPQSIGVTVGAFKKEARALYLDNNDLIGKVGEHLATIEQQDEIIKEIQKEIDDITSQLGGNDVQEQVKRIHGQIATCEGILNRDRMELKSLFERKGELKTQISLNETKRAQLSLMDKNNQRVERCKAYALRLYQDLLSEYKTKENSIRNELETSINNIFKTIYDGGLSLSIDERYNITVHVEELKDIETSTAQSISVIFAFISAIIKMARDNRAKQRDESYSEPYPLVMDAPLSAFDKKRIKAICTAIPETAEQVIIFIKDTDGELAEEHLANRVSVRHYFSKIDEFNTKLD